MDHTQHAKLRQLLDSREVRSWLGLMDAFRSIYRRLEIALAFDDCSIPRFQILFNLYFDGGLSPVELSKRLLVTRGNISTFLRRLKADGLICERKRKVSEKRPTYVVTAEGRKLFERIFPRHIARVRRLMPAFRDAEISALKKIAAEANSKAID